MQDGIFGGLEGGHLEGGVVAADVAEAAEVKEALLDLGQVGDIRLYYKGFRHTLGGINVPQIYKKVDNGGKKSQNPMHIAVYQYGRLQTEKWCKNRRFSEKRGKIAQTQLAHSQGIGSILFFLSSSLVRPLLYPRQGGVGERRKFILPCRKKCVILHPISQGNHEALYFVLANGNLGNFHFVMQVSIMVYVLCVGCYGYIYITRLFLGPPFERRGIPVPRFVVKLIVEGRTVTKFTQNEEHSYYIHVANGLMYWIMQKYQRKRDCL